MSSNRILAIIGVIALIGVGIYAINESQNDDDVGDAIEEAADEVGDAAEEVGDEVDDATDDNPGAYL
jgi:hypothetical protein